MRMTPVAGLTLAARNARTHSDAQIAQIAASIAEFGWTNPVLADENGAVIAGHGRLAAAKRLGWDHVPVLTLGGLSEPQKRALALADNKLALNAGWDEDTLRLELLQLGEDGFDLGVVGFSDDELASLLADRSEGLTDPDDAPEPQPEAVSVLGDVWLLGRHRLACGDCTDALVVERVLAGVKPHLMVTDPPYGVEYDPNWRNEADRANGKPSGDRAIGKVENDGRADWRDAWALFPGDVAYVWHADKKAHLVAESLIASGLNLRAQVIWAKNQFVIGRGDYHPQHEPCWYAVRKGAPGHYEGGRKQSTLWQIDKPRKSETGHSTQKPVECMKRPIENNSSPGQAVYEPFSGSGTTIIAAEMTGRACHAIEISPQYVDVAVRRWQQFTGKEATHAETGKTFAAVEADRQSQGRAGAGGEAEAERPATAD
ncbi:MAG: site-specific DNA-methyltransferase [Bradyrhizobium sp.]|nr:site-specific DNA-methyltransferase [Bradyrhizobium sp.]